MFNNAIVIVPSIRRHGAKVSWCLGASLAALSACGAPTSTSTDSPDAAAPSAGGSNGERGSTWSYTSTSDPMSDVRTHRASATFVGRLVDVEVRVDCGSDGRAQYEFASFNKDGSPAPMRTRTQISRFGSLNQIAFQIRLDDDPAQLLTVTNPNYANVAVLQTRPGEEMPADRAIGADRIIVRLFLPDGEETIEVDQHNDQLRRLLQPCAEHSQAMLAEQGARRLEAEESEQRLQEALERMSNAQATAEDNRTYPPVGM